MPLAQDRLLVLGHDSALARLHWANEMNIAMNHAPGAGSIARPVDQQSSALPLYVPQLIENKTTYFKYCLCTIMTYVTVSKSYFQYLLKINLLQMHTNKPHLNTLLVFLQTRQGITIE